VFELTTPPIGAFRSVVRQAYPQDRWQKSRAVWDRFSMASHMLAEPSAAIGFRNSTRNHRSSAGCEDKEPSRQATSTTVATPARVSNTSAPEVLGCRVRRFVPSCDAAAVAAEWRVSS